MYKYPYSILSGTGLGISYSSLKKIQDIFPTRDFGQAKLQVFANIANGNLIIKDYICRLIEKNGPLEFYYIFNNQDSSKWRLVTGSKWLKQLPNGQNAILTEPDGHETIYTYDSVSGKYFSQALNNSQPFLYYDANTSQWVNYYPESKIKEAFDSSGYLSTRSDEQGRTTTYHYDESTPKQVVSVQGASGLLYKLVKTSGSTIKLVIAHDTYDEPLIAWTLNGDGTLACSKILNLYTPEDNAYTISYHYSAPGVLQSISQSDGTQFFLGFDFNSPSRVITLGQGSSVTRIDYSQVPVIKVTDGDNQAVSFTLDSNSNITKIERQVGYNIPLGTEATQYVYTEKNQVQNIIYPDQSQVTNYYNALGLCTKTVGPQGQITTNYYESDTFFPNLFAVSKQIDQNAIAVTRFVYDNNYDGNGNRFLRFIVSPEGRVTEFEPYVNEIPPYGNGNPKLKRTYLLNCYPISGLQPDTPISLQQITTWKAQQDKSFLTLSTYFYDERGQVTRTYTYAQVDKDGNGVEDEEMGFSNQGNDAFGHATLLETKQTNTESAFTSQRFDALQRKTLFQDPLKNEINYLYLDSQSQIQTTYANNSVELEQYDSRALLTSTKLTASELGQSRLTSFNRDLLGRAVIITQPDGYQTYQFYDRQNRLAFTVSPSGIVLAQLVDDKNHFVQKTAYYNPVDPKKLWFKYPPIPGTLPDVSLLLKQLETIKDPSKDRTTYIFNDLSGRPRYLVDEKNYVIENRYDSANRLIGEIKYAQPLTPEFLQLLKQGQEINLVPDENVDRWWQYFHDQDNNKVATQDPAGYVTYKRFDAGNRCKESIIYATKTPHLSKLADILPPASPKDAHTLFYYNARNECVMKIDAENYVATLNYYPTGEEKYRKRYFNPMPPDWRKRITFDLPPDSVNDQVTTSSYDLLDRLVQSTLPFDKIAGQSFDSMGLQILTNAYDGKNLGNTGPDFKRCVSNKFDQFQQLIFKSENEKPEVNPFQYFYDATGLKVKEVNPMAEVNFFYFDIDRRPTITINALGAIEELTLNSFGKPEKKRVYQAAIPKEQIPTLTGGFLPAPLRDLLNSLQNDELDAITLYKYNLRGELEVVIDPLGYETKTTFNAFGEPTVNTLPLQPNTLQPSYTIEAVYNTRGLKTSITKKSTDGSIKSVNSYEYDNPLGLQTSHTNPLGQLRKKDYDRLGRVIKVYDSNQQLIKVISPDAFNRPLSITRIIDASTSLITHFTYDQTLRQMKENYAIAGSYTLVINNIFNEKVKQSDAMGNTETWEHESSGLVSKYTRQSQDGNCIIIDNYDLIHRLQSHIDANNNKTLLHRNIAGQIDSSTLNPDIEALTTTFTLDTWGRQEQIQDPKGNVTKNTFDKKDQLLQAILDPSSSRLTTTLNLISGYSYNAQGTKTASSKGDALAAKQFVKKELQDGINRTYSKIVSPDDLRLTTTLTLNLAGTTIASTDEKGNTTWYVFDDNGRERFSVNPEKGVIEKQYNLQGFTTYTRKYSNILTQRVDASTSLAQMIAYALSIASSNDSQKWYFYDENNNERFVIDSRGAVQEKRYDLANQKIADVKYYTLIDPAIIPNETTTQLVQLMKSKLNPKDRKTFYSLDELGRIRYEFDPEGYVTGRVYDGNGNTIIETLYAAALSDPESVSRLPLSEIKQHLDLTDPQNATSYYVFDLRNKPLFQVQPEGNVTSFKYDKNGNLVEQCQYQQKLSGIPSNYNDLVVVLKALVPNKANGDRITTYEHDAANRKTKSTDPKGNFEFFVWDVVNNLTARTDQNGQEWQTLYDRASRETDRMSPSTTLTKITYDSGIGKQGQLTATTSLLPEKVTDKKAYDLTVNSVTFTKAYGLPEARTCITYLNGCGLVKKVEVLKVPVDDPDKVASFKIRPEKEVTLATEIIYDGKGKPIVTKGEDGKLAFIIYDSEENPFYTVSATGSVIKNEFNAFNETVGELRYAVKITLNLNQYATTGIPLAVLQAAITTDKQDRQTITERDRRGDITTIKKGPEFYYLPNLNEPDSPTYGTDYSQEVKRYNAARDCYYEAKLINPISLTFEATITLYDLNRNAVATINPNNYVVISTFSAFNQEIDRVEYGKPTTQSPSPTITLSKLRQLLQPDATTDRHFVKQYDLCGLLDKTTLTDTYQTLRLDKTKPVFDDSTGDLVVSTDYSKTGKPSAYTYENGSKEFIYYDERDLEKGRTQVPRVSLNQNNENVIIIPFVEFGVNAFGERVKTLRYAEGTASASQGTFPTPINPTSANNQLQLVQIDRRGRTALRQDPENNLFGFTYTAINKEARHWHQLTQWTYSTVTKSFSNTYPIDDTRYGDPDKDGVSFALYRDGLLIFSIYSKHNAFGEVIAQGPDGKNYPTEWSFNRRGKVWRTNQARSAYIDTCYDLRDQETASLASTTNNLKDYDLLAIMSWQYNQLERTERVLDLAGNVVAALAPAYPESNDSGPQAVPISMLLNAQKLDWLLPQERNYEMVFTIWPEADSNQKQVCNIVGANSRLTVDISKFRNDVYQYEIDYLMTLSNSTEKKKVYFTQGLVQFDNGNNTNSLRLVAIALSDTQIALSGNNLNLLSLELWQDTNKIATIAPSNPLDLSAYPSGTYTLKPNYQNGSTGVNTLPFTIYTAVPSALPLAREIDFEISLEVDGQTVAMPWQVTPGFNQQPINFQCDYIDSNDQQQQQSGTLQPDSKQISFDYEVKTITKLSVNLRVLQGAQPSDDIWIPMLVNAVPVANQDLKDWVMVSKVSPDDNWVDLSHSKIVVRRLVPAFSVNFTPRVLIYITPMVGYSTPPTLQCLDTSLDIHAGVRSIVATGVTSQGIVADVTLLPKGKYLFSVGAYKDIPFTITNGLQLYPSLHFPTKVGGEVAVVNSNVGAVKVIRPIHRYAYDAWNNLVKEGTALNHETVHRYNRRNQEIYIQQPSVSVTFENGTTATATPVVKKAYDKRGFFIGEINPKSYATGYFLDAAGQPLKDILADGTVSRYRVFNALLQESRYQDASGNWWQQTYNHNNKLTRFSFPSGTRFQMFGYNELGACTYISNANLRKTYQNYDVYGYMSAEYQVDGSVITRTNSRQGIPTRIVNADNMIITNAVDFNGVINSHTDLSGASYTYKYDYKGQLIGRVGTKNTSHGQNISLNYMSVQTGDGPKWILHKYVYDTLNQNMSWRYSAGRLIEELDEVESKKTLYNFDIEGRLIQRKLYSPSYTLVRTINRELDAIGREIGAYDDKLNITIGLDLNGNRVRITSKLTLSANNYATDERWSSFDALDNILIDGGSLLNNTIVMGKGISYSYSKALRTSETRANLTPAILHYDTDLLLDKITRGTDTVTRSYNEAMEILSVINSAGEGFYYYRNNKGFTTKEEYYRNSQLHSRVSYTDLSLMGYPYRQETTNIIFKDNSPNGQAVDTLTHQYALFDDLKTTKVGGTRAVTIDGETKVSDYQSVTIYHDANGNTTAVRGQYDPDYSDTKSPSMTALTSTSSGIILSKQVYHNIDGGTEVTQGPLLLNFLTVDDQLLGTYQPTRASSLKFWQYLQQAVSPMGGIQTGVPSYWRGLSRNNPFSSLRFNRQGGSTFQYADPTPSVIDQPKATEENKNPGLQFSFPPPGPSTCTAMAGDNPERIAERLFASNNYASQIEGANGLVGDNSLYSGYPNLHLPLPVPSQNKSTTYASYQAFTSKLIGALYPYIKTPEFKVKTHQSIWSAIVTIAVEAIAVAVSIMVAPELTGLLLGTLAQGAIGTAATTVIAGVTAAVIDAAGQELEKGLGLRDHFSWAEVGSVGIAAAIGVNQAPTLNEKLVQAMLRAGVTSSIQQLGQMALGQSHFDLKLVAASILSAGITRGVSANIPKATLNRIQLPMSQLTSAIVTPLIAGKHLDLEMIAAQAIGGVAGEYLGSQIGMAVNNQLHQIENHLSAMKRSVSNKMSSPESESSSTSNSANRHRLASVNEKTNQATGNSKKASAFVAQPAKAWDKLWEQNASDYLSDMVEEDLNPDLRFAHQLSKLKEDHPDLVQGLNDRAWIDKKTGSAYVYSRVNGEYTFALKHEMPVEPVDIDRRALEWMAPVGKIGRLALQYAPAVVDDMGAYLGKLGLFKDNSSTFELLEIANSTQAEREALRRYILKNIAESKVARDSSNYPILTAKADQFLSGYNIDQWTMAILKQGEIVYGGLPGRSSYYTTIESVLASGGDKQFLGELLQIKPHVKFGYRPNIGEYIITKDVRVPVGIVEANSNFGVGKSVQYFINKDLNYVKLTNEYTLEDFYEFNLPSHRISH